MRLAIGKLCLLTNTYMSLLPILPQCDLISRLFQEQIAFNEVDLKNTYTQVQIDKEQINNTVLNNSINYVAYSIPSLAGTRGRAPTFFQGGGF